MRRRWWIAMGGLAALMACSSGEEQSVEAQAWASAGVDDPTFTLVETEHGHDLEVVVESSLPIEDANHPQRFADRVAQIVWRTHPADFRRLTVTVQRDGEPLFEPTEYSARSLEILLGPRPAGLDDGEARDDPEPADDGALRAVVDAADDRDIDTVRESLFEPLLEATVDGHFGSETLITVSEPTECLGGLAGNEPTGRFRVTVSAAVEEAYRGRHLLPALVDWWRTQGLDVNTARFDSGGHSVSVRFDDFGTLVATAGEDALTIAGQSDCKDPG